MYTLVADLHFFFFLLFPFGHAGALSLFARVVRDNTTANFDAHAQKNGEGGGRGGLTAKALHAISCLVSVPSP